MMTTDNQYTILVVDDNPNNLGVLSDFLGEMGFEILVARDGESALQRVSYANPDLILLDVMMPGIDGFETCRRLQAQADTREIPVIFMTALSDSSDKVQGLSLGAVDYITKPFQQDEVLARVKLHLKLYHLKQTLSHQNQKLKGEIENRKGAEAALQNLNQDLEKRVAARTAELSQALHDLKQTQLQMVQGEKLAALGQLVTGVAHEINNPINFIAGNINHANDYVENILELLGLYQQAFPEGTPEIQSKSEDIDIEFVQEDLSKVLASMTMGADRIRDIVQSLCSFSRSDESTAKAVNIHDGIDSTLMILNSRIKAKMERPAIEIVKDYGELPLVDCYPGPLNQVFMNLLANAIDSLEEGYQVASSASPQIRISTTVTSGNTVTIRVSDNGPGMTEAVRQQLFQPFFTTKPMGKGTGLGLSISYQVITESHHGSLECHSSPGEGAEFVIQIPVSRSSESDSPAIANGSVEPSENWVGYPAIASRG